MISQAHLDAIPTMPGFTSDPGGSVRAAVRRYLWTYAGGRCVVCGQATRLEAKPTDADRAEGCHALPAPGRGGYVAPNVFNGCRKCNENMKDRDVRGQIGQFELPHLIPASWPKRKELVEMYGADKSDMMDHIAQSNAKARELGWM